MVSKSLDIHAASLAPFEPSKRRLLLELAPNALTAILWDKDKNLPVAVEVFNGDISKSAERQTIMEQSRLLGYKDLEALVISAFPNILPVPSFLYTPASAQQQLSLLFGQYSNLYTGGDVIAEQSMVVSWQMPTTVHQFLVNRFKVLQVRHLVTHLINNFKSGKPAKGNIVVYGSLVWITLWQNDQLLLAKSVEVGHPDDLSYQLLNICKQFALEPAQTFWQLSGMVAQDSPMWAAASRFFEQVEALPISVQLPEDLPGYYFAHLF